MEKQILAERPDKIVYRQGDKVFKKFGPSFSRSDILNEALNQVRIEETGLNIPHLHEVCLLDDERMIVMDYIEGKTLKELMDENPDKMDEYLELFVDLQLEIHQKRSPLLNEMHAKMRRKIRETELNATIRYELDTRLAGMPKHRKVCHGDFNPSNIIITEDGTPYVLDWSHVTQGNGSHDVSRTYLGFCLQGQIDLAEKYRDLYAKKTDTALQYILKWMPIVAAEQLANDGADEEERDFLMGWIDVVEYE
ncbi:aminoglycoside phosphotransferase family protein [Amphibacillus indicireducens]|uniref:Aminoglycoside phosphotransferase family protein n=1 Tax=Amphibacillus indicireducens TaxID=1076330 RepID=A0ABP7VGT1_9BACI